MRLEPKPYSHAHGQPQDHDEDRPKAAARCRAFGLHPLFCLTATFRKDFRRQQPDGQPDEDRKQQNIIDIAQHRDEVWNQVNGAQRIGHHKDAQRLGVPRCSRIFSCKPERYGVAFDSLGPLSQVVADSHGRRHVGVRCQTLPPALKDCQWADVAGWLAHLLMALSERSQAVRSLRAASSVPRQMTRGRRLHRSRLRHRPQRTRHSLLPD